MLILQKGNCISMFAQRKEAVIKYQVVLEKMRHEELQKQQTDEAQQSQEAELKLHHV